MNQFRIGKFISECRKKKGITQNELAELLGITNRAVSKWETGICMPDAGTIPELCQILDISISDLFSGEKSMENNKDSEKFILKLVKEKAERDKQLLILEILIGILSTSVLVSFILLASFINVSVYVKFIIILCGIILFAVGIFYALLIERIAGYYECSKCHHKYIPTYKQILFSMHAFRTRYMKCPKCKCSSWSKKVIS
ncbi:MAG: helix-turn-helix transcriptional regulator [Bacilli bacterium]|jgi:transcriptional regulator with XRE-family HTH domain|nr:helix-turn-helix transcriptional regulator [Bacilli bacterium]